MLQKQLQFTFASFGYFSETVPKHAELTNKATITIPEKQGDRILFINSDQLLFTPTVPQNHMKLLFAFG